MTHAADLIDQAIQSSGSRACVGLDPRPDMLPEALRQRIQASDGAGALGVGKAFSEFNRAIIDAIAGACAAVKPQVACYEAYGTAGWQALIDTIAAANEAGIPVIADAKRGDLGSTAVHYGDTFFGGSPGLDGEAIADGGVGAQWLTVNPYLGSDSVLTIQGDADLERGVFVLVKTSNPSSGELQDLALAETDEAGPALVVDAMADRVREWGENRIGACGLSDVGAVVGATYPDEARRLRERMPNTLFLVPGYGAQGAGAADALAGARPDGSGVLISSSRGITAAWKQSGTDDYATAARAALDAMNADLKHVRNVGSVAR